VSFNFLKPKIEGCGKKHLAKKIALTISNMKIKITSALSKIQKFLYTHILNKIYVFSGRPLFLCFSHSFVSK